MIRITFENLLVNYASALNQLKDKYTSARQLSNMLRSDRQRGDYMSTLLVMDCKDTDFFFKLYEIVESHRIVLQINLDDIFLKERFDMVNQSQKHLPQSS